MEVMSKEKRKVCWRARDAFIECAKSYRNKDVNACKVLKEKMIADCPQKWSEHFLDKTEIEINALNQKEKENEGDPIDKLPDLPRAEKKTS